MEQRAPSLWFPFSSSEVSHLVGLLGIAATLASALGGSGEQVLKGSAAIVLVAYLAGLLVHSRRYESRFELIDGGALGGDGYIPLFRRAKTSLLLTHVDDDPPSEELLALYRRLLARGVQMRRLLFLRRGHAPSSMDWVEDFGDHPGLEQRVILPGEAEVMRTSFVVIDEATVAFSIPGTDISSAHDYGRAMVLKDLLIIRDSRVSAAFVEAHRQLWGAALPRS